MTNPGASAFRRALVPLDGSPAAEAALPVAGALAQRSGGEVRLLHVLEVPPVFAYLDPGSEEQGTAEGYLARATALLGEGISVTTSVQEGPIDTQVVREVEGWGADLVVMASHGRGGASRLWLGSVADRCVRGSPIPVLMVRATPQGQGAHPFAMKRVIVPLDGSETAEAALPHAAALARLFETPIELVQVVSPADAVALFDSAGPRSGVTVRFEEAHGTAGAYLERQASALRATGTPATTAVVVDPVPARIILERAAGDPVVLTTHGRGGWKRALLGSVADKVVRGAEGPVLVVPTGSS